MMLFLLLSFSLQLRLSSTLSCTGPNGDVEWFTALKMPKVKQFLYADVESQHLSKSQSELSDPRCAIAKTLAPIYSTTNTNNFTKSDTSKDLNYLMYNDQVPGGPTIYDRAHAKGVLMFDDYNIVFLVHSTPHFPNNKSGGYEFPDSGIKYGQSFLCMTLEIDQLPKVLVQLRVMWPYVYEYQISTDMSSKYPDLIQLIKGVPEDVDTSIAMLVLSKGTHITSFAKDKAFNADIYQDFIAPYLKVNLFTETWQNGAGRLPSNCSQDYFVKNMRRIDLLGYEYKETKDHSKWAISADNTPLLCIGGVNRMRTQFLRGGGGYCLKDCEVLWNDIRSGVAEVEECQ